MPDALQIALKNDSNADQLFAYVTGIALQHDGQRCLLKANGHDLYFPKDVPDIGTPLAEDCAIPLGAPGTTVTVTVPQLAGGRIWIAEGGPLTFLLNPGPALVEPSVLNPSDANACVNFGFAEFTLNDAQLFANLSFVDFVPRLPIALTLQQNSGEIQHVAGLAPNGLARMADDLFVQAGKDGWPWDRLVVPDSDADSARPLRILNATHGAAVGADFAGYYEPHVAEVWRAYAHGGRARLRINTQSGAGVVTGQVNGRGQLQIGTEEFARPSTADIFGCNSGPFAPPSPTASPTRNAIIPRLAAAFVRSTLLCAATAEEEVEHPTGPPSTFYAAARTHHYARLVHEHTLDRKGYAFAYDDVQPDGGDDQSGKVNAGDPMLFTVTVGGKSAGDGPAGLPRPRSTPTSLSARSTPPPPSLQTPPPVPRRNESPARAPGLRGRIRGLAESILR